MSLQDSISDMLTRIRNAQHAKKFDVSMPGSKAKSDIARVLKEEGYIADFETHEQPGNKKTLVIELKYFDGKPVIDEIVRASKPSLRKYVGAEDLPQVKGGLGIAIVSTSHGLMTDRAARKLGQGGEVICFVS